MLFKTTQTSQTWEMPKHGNVRFSVGSSAQSKGPPSHQKSANGCTFFCQVMSQLVFAGPGKAMNMQSKALGEEF